MNAEPTESKQLEVKQQVSTMEVDEPEVIVGLDDDLPQFDENDFIALTCSKIESSQTPQPPKTFKVSRKNLQLTKMLANAMENEPEEKEILLKEITPTAFEMILEYLNHHAGTAPPALVKPAPFKTMEQNCKKSDPWDAKFIDDLWAKDKELFYEVLHGALYLDCDPLRNLGCCKVAIEIRNAPQNELPRSIIPPKKFEDLIRKGELTPEGHLKIEEKPQDSE